MKIKDTRRGDSKLFQDIEEGQVFLDENGCYWLKIRSFGEDDNAVDLDDGMTSRFGEVENVYPLDAELIIK